MIRGIGFDLWETLLTNSAELSDRQRNRRVQRLRDVLAAAEHAIELAEIDRAHGEVWRRCHEHYWSRDDDIPTRRQIEVLVEALQIACDDPLAVALEEAYSDALLDHPPAIVEGARELLRDCSDRGLRIGLVSNTGRTPGSVLRRLLASLELEAHFDVMVFSNEVGACKPRPVIFDRLLEGLAVPPGETVFIGDNLHADVGGAQRAGMRGVHFDPPVRGTAYAPCTADVEVVPWARVRRLREVTALLGAGR